MYCDGLEPDIYSDYVLGNLGAGPDLDELHSHLGGGCARCKSEIASTRTLWYKVALAEPVVEPRGALRKRVVATVREPRTFAWWQPVAALAALAVGVFTGTQVSRQAPPPVVAVLPSINVPLIAPEVAPRFKSVPPPAPVVVVKDQDISGIVARATTAERELVRQKELLASVERDREDLNRKYQAAISQPKPDTSGIERQLTAAQLRTQQLEHDVTEYRTLLAKSRESALPAPAATMLSDPNLRLVRLRGTNGVNAEGHAFVSGGSQVVFYASKLPALPAGRTYQLWLIRASVPAIVSAGLFQPDVQSRAIVRFEKAGFTTGITTVAVTDEPEGGSATPTGHKLLIGS